MRRDAGEREGEMPSAHLSHVQVTTPRALPEGRYRLVARGKDAAAHVVTAVRFRDLAERGEKRQTAWQGRARGWRTSPTSETRLNGHRYETAR